MNFGKVGFVSFGTETDLLRVIGGILANDLKKKIADLQIFLLQTKYWLMYSRTNDEIQMHTFSKQHFDTHSTCIMVQYT